MSSRFSVVSNRHVVTLIVLALAVCLLGTYAAAQNANQPKDEVYVGYSWLHTDRKSVV